jgi:hypothetical protein
MNSPLLVTLPYCNKDIAAAERLLKWIDELNTSLCHSLLLVGDSLVSRDKMKEFKSIASRSFHDVEAIIVTVPTNRQAWGTATKAMFEHTASQVSQCYKLPWLWLEPDCVPLKPTWLDELAYEYAFCPRRYMGAHVTASQLKSGPPHMAGPAIYPSNAYAELVPYLNNGEHFDLCIAPHVLPRSSNTDLIHHFWGTQELAPTFKSAKLEGDPENVLTMAHIKPGAVLWHRNKDGTLIDMIRTETAAEALLPSEPKRRPGRPRKLVEAPLVPAATSS